MEEHLHFKYQHDSIIIKEKRNRINIIQYVSLVKKRYFSISNNIISNNIEAFIIFMILFELDIPLYFTYYNNL